MCVCVCVCVCMCVCVCVGKCTVYYVIFSEFVIYIIINPILGVCL